MDNSRINIIVDSKINKVLEKTCQEIVDALLNEKPYSGATKLQDSTAKFFIDTFKNNREQVEIISIIALHNVMLCREHLYRLNIEVQKSQTKLHPIQRKGLRFHAGYNCSQIFKSIFNYKIPYFIKDQDFTQYSHLFNPIFLSGSFPEYFLSDYFCYLGIKKPLWTFERFCSYRRMLRNSSKYGLSSFIGVSLTSKGASLQVIYRIIKGKHKTFNEDTVDEIIKLVQDDPEILSEILNDRAARKSLLSGDFPKNLSKNEIIDTLQTEFQLASSRIPLSEFFDMALEAEILRKIMNNIVLIDPIEYPQGYGDLLSEYSLYLVRPPYIYEERETTPEPGSSTVKLKVDPQKNEVIEKDETVRIHFDYDALMEEIKNRNDSDSAKIEEETGKPAKRTSESIDEKLIKEQAKKVEEVIDGVVDGISQEEREYLSMPELSAEEMAQISDEDSENNEQDGLLDTSNAQENIPEVKKEMSVENGEQKASPPVDPVVTFLASLRRPFLYGLFDVLDEGNLFLKERQLEDESFLLEEVEPKEANFKIVIGKKESRFLINKKSNWQKPTVLKEVKEGVLAAALQSKIDDTRYYFYLLDKVKLNLVVEERVEIELPEVTSEQSTESLEKGIIDETARGDQASDEKPITQLQDLYGEDNTIETQSVEPAQTPKKDLSEFATMSVGELSQALLDDLIGIDDYNSLVADRKDENETPSVIMEEPDVVLNEGVNYCSDWQGRILSGNENEADLRIIIEKSHFLIEVKSNNKWTVLVPRTEIVTTGTKGEFQKDIIFNDPTATDVDKSARIIKKEFSYQLFPLMGGIFGIKFF